MHEHAYSDTPKGREKHISQSIPDIWIKKTDGFDSRLVYAIGLFIASWPLNSNLEMIKEITEELNNLNLEGVELTKALFGGMSKKEYYNIHTTQERIAELKTIEAQEYARKKKEREREWEEQSRRDRQRLMAAASGLVTKGVITG